MSSTAPPYAPQSQTPVLSNILGSLGQICAAVVALQLKIHPTAVGWCLLVVLSERAAN